MEIARFPRFEKITVTELSQPGEARRSAMAIAASLGFDEVKCGQVGVIVTELSRNIVIHGGGGEVILAAWKYPDGARMDILAIDNGPGISDIGKALEDGVSSAGTPGTGLGAVSRMADNFEIFSQNTGTVVLAQLGASDTALPVSMGAVSVPIKGEKLCGDALISSIGPERSIFMVVDGLGHGPLAAEAAQEALEVFEMWQSTTPADLIERVHDALKKTRGAAVAVTEVFPQKNTVTYAGVGNIVGVIVPPDGQPTRSMVSHNGIVGHQMGRNAEFTYPWLPGSILVMHSDGLSNHWNINNYPGLSQKSPALIAGLLFRDKARKADDATVLIARPRQGSMTEAA